MGGKAFGALGVCLCATSAAQAQVRITEWMYNGIAEFVEFTNVSGAPVDMTGWSFDDSNAIVGAFDLSAFGTVAPGESVLITQALAGDFKLDWGLGAGVKVIGELGVIGASHNLGRNDAMNLFDDSGALADTLVYGDETFPGSIRTNGISGNPATPAALGANDPYQWVLSSFGDGYGSYFSLGGEEGNPGVYIPEPASALLIVFGGGVAALRRRRARA